MKLKSCAEVHLTHKCAGGLVNEKYEILHFLGKTDKYLEMPRGKARFNIVNMAREGLRLKLSTGLHNAVRQKKTTTHEALRIEYDDGLRIVDLTVRPLTEATAAFLRKLKRGELVNSFETQRMTEDGRRLDVYGKQSMKPEADGT